MTDQIIRDIPLIQRYSRHNEAEDYRFRAYLKGSLNLSNAALDAVVQEETNAVWSQIDCTNCAHCCRSLQIVVDNKDIERLAKHFSMTPQAFSQRYVQIAADKTKHFNSPPCPFLQADNRCSVYEDRPQACRDFPFLHAKDFRSRSLIMVENTGVCPIVFNTWQALKRRFGRVKRK